MHPTFVVLLSQTLDFTRKEGRHLGGSPFSQ
jgi:hypothetical protein